MSEHELATVATAISHDIYDALANRMNISLGAFRSEVVPLILKRINAALTAEKKNYAAWRITVNETHRQQLAAEKEKVAELTEQNKTFRVAQKACEDCDGPTMAEVQELREQLVAERKKANETQKSMAQRIAAACVARDNYKAELAAERERSKLNGEAYAHMATEYVKDIERLNEQLAAEREKVPRVPLYESQAGPEAGARRKVVHRGGVV